MRVLIITHEKHLGGATKSMLNLIDALRGRVEYFVIVPAVEGPIIDELIKREIKFFYVHSSRWMMTRDDSRIQNCFSVVKYLFFGQFRNCYEAVKLKRIIEEFNIDIIHTNNSVINLGAFLYRNIGIPHIWHIREYGLEDHGMVPRCSEKRFYDTIDKNSTEVIAISEALRKKYSANLRSKKPKVIYNGVGAENIINIEDKNMDKSCVKFLISGSFHAGKGQDIAIGAVHKLLREGEEDFKLYIAGRGNEEWLKGIKGFKNDHIVLLGQVKDMPSLRKGMDIELVCSRSEAFGRVTVEAMMGCMPVIGSNSGGTPELIEDGVTGFLFEKGNAEELAEKMKYFIHNKEKILEMGQNAQEYALEYFTIERCANEVYEEYCAVLRREGGYYMS